MEAEKSERVMAWIYIGEELGESFQDVDAAAGRNA